MPNWTDEQKEAIYVRDTNVIVSAGAGSGKTAVLTERVYQMILEGYGLDEIVVLTFTNAAAFEMRERIRGKLLKDPLLKEKAQEVDTSYIMTFDAFALALVKKYHYLLDLDQKISITDDSIVQIQRMKEIDAILKEYYLHPTVEFENYMHRFALRDDRDFKRFLLKIDANADLEIDRDSFLAHYEEEHFALEKIEKDLNTLVTETKKRLEEIILKSREMEDLDDQRNIEDSLTPFLTLDDYQSTYERMYGYNFPRRPARKDAPPLSEEEEKYRDALKKIAHELRDMFKMLGDKNTAISRYLSTKTDVHLCLDMVNELHERMVAFKKAHHIFTFSDIAKLALSLLDHPLVIEELKNKIRAVMVDEYQDTSDIQDAFLMKLSHNNLYMVGDIKQSIYRFRNANCNLFMDKYLRYAQNNGGKKIDLNQNFRSRKEVIEDINLMFSNIMFLDYGGANYKQDHIILFGNKSYVEEGKTEEDYHLDVFTYYPDQKGRKEDEVRLIAEDIVKKVHTYPIFDKGSKEFHKAEYRDFAILMDRKTDFDRYQKIFEEYHIPIRVEKDDNLIASYPITTLQSLLKVYYAILKQKFDATFEHAYCSLYRSFIYCGSDLELEEIVKNKDYKNTELFIKVQALVNELHSHSLAYQVRHLIDAFDFENRLISIGDIEKGRKQIEHVYDTISTMEEMEYTLEDFITYLAEIHDLGIQLTSSYEDDGSDSVRLLSIHKSKGLEFPIVYYSGLSNDFNLQDLKGLFLSSLKYGILVPVVDERAPDTFYHYLARMSEINEELSEKIRLFYVAATRAKEKMIYLYNLDKKDHYFLSNSKSLLDLFMRSEVPSEHFHFKEIVGPIATQIDEEEKNESLSQIEIRSIDIPQVVRTSKRASLTAIDVEESTLAYGENLHFIFEMLDFHHLSLDFIRDPKEKHYVQQFLASSLYQDHQHEKFYHEYAYFDEETQKEGIIDLLFIGEKEATVIDFKTSVIDPIKYKDQLATYQKYVERTFHLPVRCYLYSIMKGEFIEL